MGVLGRVLVVDDEESIRNLLAECLTQMNLDVETAIDGQDALNKFNKGRFDLIVSDLIMPNMDGLELLKKVCEIDEEAIFIMITGYPTIQTAMKTIREGAYDYITKPFNVEDIKHRINRAFERKTLTARLKNVRGFAWALLLSIPIWLILGIVLATFLN